MVDKKVMNSILLGMIAKSQSMNIKETSELFISEIHKHDLITDINIEDIESLLLETYGADNIPALVVSVMRMDDSELNVSELPASLALKIDVCEIVIKLLSPSLKVFKENFNNTKTRELMCNIFVENVTRYTIIKHSSFEEYKDSSESRKTIVMSPLGQPIVSNTVEETATIGDGEEDSSAKEDVEHPDSRSREELLDYVRNGGTLSDDYKDYIVDGRNIFTEDIDNGKSGMFNPASFIPNANNIHEFDDELKEDDSNVENDKDMETFKEDVKSLISDTMSKNNNNNNDNNDSSDNTSTLWKLGMLVGTVILGVGAYNYISDDDDIVI